MARGRAESGFCKNWYNVCMKKMIAAGFMLVCTFAALAQVSVISVKDEDKHATKDDFSHTFEYYIVPQGGGTGGKCQATRIERRWFATAAHCVTPLCDKGCTIQLDLLEQPLSALATVQHTPKQPAVFVHPQYSAGSFALNDFALFRLDLDRTPLAYYRRGEPNTLVPAKTFSAFLNKNRTAASQLKHIQSPSFPRIILFGNGNFLLKGRISVISIFGGKRKVKQNVHPVHYVNDLGFAYTENFGVIKGMSGSGVMTNTGELAGIISGNLTSTIRSGFNQAAQTKEFFMFPVFNKSTAGFMQSVMGSDYYKLDWTDSYPALARKSRQNYAGIVSLVRSATE